MWGLLFFGKFFRAGVILLLISLVTFGCITPKVTTTIDWQQAGNSPDFKSITSDKQPAIEQDALTWLQNKYPQMQQVEKKNDKFIFLDKDGNKVIIGNGQCTELKKTLSGGPAFGWLNKATKEYNGAKQYYEKHKDKIPLLRDVDLNNISRCDVILFTGSEYDEGSGHTAVVYQVKDGKIWILEQNNPTGAGVQLRPITQKDLDSKTAIISRDCKK